MAVAPRSIDPSGIAPVTDPSVVGGAADASPTTLVLQYLKQRGYQPSSENVRRALEANQRDPGVIPGLRSDRPATEAEDQAAMAAAGKGGGSKNTSAPPPPPGGDLAHPVDLNWQTVNPNQPPGSDSSGLADAAKIAGLVLGTGGLGAAGMYGAYKLADRFNPPPVAGPGAGVPPPVDPGAGVPRVGGPEIPPLLPAPEAQATPLDAAMNRAVAGPQQPLRIEQSPVAGVAPVGPPGAADMAPPRGPVEPVAPVVPFRSDPALRTSPNLRGAPPPLVRPGRLRVG